MFSRQPLLFGVVSVVLLGAFQVCAYIALIAVHQEPKLSGTALVAGSIYNEIYSTPYNTSFPAFWNEVDPFSGKKLHPGEAYGTYPDSASSWDSCIRLRCVRTARCHHPSHSASIDQLSPHQPHFCCVDLLLLLLAELSSFLNERSVPHSLMWGSLLGSLRSEDVIPWTADGDLALPAWAIHRS